MRLLNQPKIESKIEPKTAANKDEITKPFNKLPKNHKPKTLKISASMVSVTKFIGRRKAFARGKIVACNNVKAAATMAAVEIVSTPTPSTKCAIAPIARKTVKK